MKISKGIFSRRRHIKLLILCRDFVLGLFVGYTFLNHHWIGITLGILGIIFIILTE